MKKVTDISIKIFLTFSLFILFACTEKKQETTTNTNNKYGDMYVSASMADAIYLNPILAGDSASSTINSYIFNGLLKYDKDLNLVCDLAENYEILNNGLQILFKLKKNILWHDGKSFTVHDVKFTYDKLIDEKTRTPFSSDYLAIKKFNIIDDYTFAVEYNEPFAPILESWCMGIIPKHIFDTEDINTSKYNRQPIGTGQFKFEKWITDQKIVLSANPDYYEGKPYIEKYLFRIIPDQSVQFLELRNETIDEISLTPDQWNAYPIFFKEYNKYSYPSFSFTFLGFNLLKEPYDNKKFRQAINYAIDKQDIIKGVLSNRAKAANGIFPPQSWAYKEIEPFE